MNKTLHPDKIHSWLKKEFKSAKETYSYLQKGVGEDDCAIINLKGNDIVFTTDFLNAEPIAKKMKLCDYRDIGRLLVAVNLSDLCGSGAKPIGFMISLMLEKTFLEKDFKALISGVKSELFKYKLPLIGGDTKLGKATALCGFAIGTKYNGGSSFFTKTDAVPGHSLWVSGNVGSVAAAVDGLVSDNIELSQSWKNWARKVIISSDVPLAKSKFLSINRVGVGGTDLSDGLADSIYELCETSNVGVIVNIENIPLHKNVLLLAKRKNIAPWKYSFSIGGDFQFIITCDSKYDEMLSRKQLFKIGVITKQRKCFYLFKNKKYILPRLGHTDYNLSSYEDEIRNHINSHDL